MFANLARPLFGEPGADSAKADQTNPDHACIRRPAASAPPWHHEALGSVANATLACCAASNVMPRQRADRRPAGIQRDPLKITGLKGVCWTVWTQLPNGIYGIGGASGRVQTGRSLICSKTARPNKL